LNKKKLEKASEHFTLFELYYSNDAIFKYKISNMPPTNGEIIRVESCFRKLVANVLEPTRVHFKVAMDISSAYRGNELNSKLSKAPNGGDHPLGKAVDFTMRNIPLLDIVKFIAKNLQFDQLILENHNGARWIHVSYRDGANRKQIMKYENGVYSPLKV
jgi:hypothetical protein